METIKLKTLRVQKLTVKKVKAKLKILTEEDI